MVTLSSPEKKIALSKKVWWEPQNFLYAKKPQNNFPPAAGGQGGILRLVISEDITKDNPPLPPKFRKNKGGVIFKGGGLSPVISSD